jgi:hypothetical protein
MKNWPHDRSHYRIEYPRRERPSLLLGGREFSVVDCCENGLRFMNPGVAFQRDDPVDGIVRFQDRVEVPVAGRAVRVQGGQVALCLDGTGVPFPVILSEQRFLRANYPMWPARVDEDEE